MGKGIDILFATAGVLTVAQVGIAAYFYRRTMKRNRAKVERTMKMAGTDWNQYIPMIKQRRQKLMMHEHRDVYVASHDGLKLHATYFPAKQGKKLVICFHGYTSEGMNDYVGLSDYYLKHGYGMLILDERAHGQSEGEYIGFGCLDRLDAMKWIKWAIRECGEEIEILLHGTSMGGATVLMASGLKLPKQVKGIVSDCAFTSPKYVFTHVLNSMYHMPAFFTIKLADILNRRLAGYGMDECNAAREVRKAKVPILFIHGDGDTFVPCEMCHEIYENCASEKRKLIVKGAAHAECYYKDMGAYENALTEFTEGIMNIK